MGLGFRVILAPMVYTTVVDFIAEFYVDCSRILDLETLLRASTRVATPPKLRAWFQVQGLGFS